jgi:protein-S-isoprenylcysteine O-methyltransferase Ste14
MPVHSYFVLAVFTVMLLVLMVQYFRIRRPDSDFFGEPTIEKLPFYTGKIAIFITWALFMLKAVYPRLGYINTPEFLSWTAVGLLYVGSVIITLSLVNLGKSLAVGLPAGETALQTHGIYRYSRNPLYLGVFLIAIGSCLYFPDLINVAFTLYGMYIHHQIIQQEEHFLSVRFGKEWQVYSEQVNRYL